MNEILATKISLWLFFKEYLRRARTAGRYSWGYWGMEPGLLCSNLLSVWRQSISPQLSFTLYLLVSLAKCPVNYPTPFKIPGKDLRNYVTLRFKGLIQLFVLSLNDISKLEQRDKTSNEWCFSGVFRGHTCLSLCKTVLDVALWLSWQLLLIKSSLFTAGTIAWSHSPPCNHSHLDPGKEMLKTSPINLAVTVGWVAWHTRRSWAV